MQLMKNIRLWVSAIVALCTTAVVAQTTGATLTVGSIEGAAGKEVSVPLYLTNAEEVVAVQFDVELPYTLTSDIVLSENRKDGHIVNRKSIGANKYTVTVMSFSNSPIKGNSGLLMRLPMTVAAEAQADDTYPMTLSNIVVAKADGANVATATEHTATFTVQRVPTPDLIVADVTVDEANRTLVPGDKLRVHYTVTNGFDFAHVGDNAGFGIGEVLDNDVGGNSVVGHRNLNLDLFAVFAFFSGLVLLIH